jgi:hypothetical protein
VCTARPYELDGLGIYVPVVVVKVNLLTVRRASGSERRPAMAVGARARRGAAAARRARALPASGTDGPTRLAQPGAARAPGPARLLAPARALRGYPESGSLRPGALPLPVRLAVAPASPALPGDVPGPRPGRRASGASS